MLGCLGMQVQRLSHIGSCVTELEASVAFYRDVVGLKEIPESSNLEISGVWFDQLTENDGAKLRVSHLDLAGVQLQLVEYAAAGGERRERRAPLVLEELAKLKQRVVK